MSDTFNSVWLDDCKLTYIRNELLRGRVVDGIEYVDYGRNIRLYFQDGAALEIGLHEEFYDPGYEIEYEINLYFTDPNATWDANIFDNSDHGVT